MASGLILLPLLLTKLPAEEFGMYQIFLRLIALIPILDFGFSVSAGRFVSYAMGGATELKKIGVEVKTEPQAPPNYDLLWKLLFAYRRLYRYLTVGTFLVLGIWGTYNVSSGASETASPQITWMAWAVTLIAAASEIYLGWWNVYLRCLNQVVLASRLAVLGYVVQLVVASSLLLLGWGLMSIPVGTVIGGYIQRLLSRHYCLRLLPGEPPLESPRESNRYITLLWPNTWRAGLQFLSTYIGTTVPALLFANVVGTAAFGSYGLSFQVFNICTSMAAVWTLVKWPQVGQLRVQGDYTTLRRMLWPRVWLQNLTFIALAIGVVMWGPELLTFIRPDKKLLAESWLILLALTAFLEMRFSFWTTLLSTENRIPSLWPTVVTNIAAILLFFAIVHLTKNYLSALVISPLIAGSLFSYWYWPLLGARSLQTSFLAFIVRKI